MRRFVISGLILPFVLAACGDAKTEKVTPEARGDVAQSPEIIEVSDRGATIAETNCAACHAIGVDGVSPHAEAPPFRTLSAKYPIDALAEPLAEGIMVGHPDMPEFQFEPDDIDALLTYIESVQPDAR